MRSMHRRSTSRVSPRARQSVLYAAAAVLASVLSLVVLQAPAGAAGCGFFGLFTCTPTPSAAAPGTAVAQLPQVNQSTSGGTNAKVGNVPSTTRIGTPNAGTVPVVGLANARADDGAYVAYESRLDARTLDLMIYSPALKGAAPVRLLLPPDWSSRPASTWPALYLIHGGADKADYQSWSLYTAIPQETAGVDALIVMPSVGKDAFATNYWNYGLANQGNQYDTFVATELPQLLQRGYRASTRAAIAGISSGGYSALALAALHPGEYGAAASYSGLIDTSSPVTAAIMQAGKLTEFECPLAMWGDYLLQNANWRAHNPAALVANLRNTPVFVSAGDGDPGPLDKPGFAVDVFEPTVQGTSKSFAQDAQAAGVPLTTDFYGSGTHTWPYWDREFGRSWPILATALGLSGSVLGTSS